MHEMLIRVEIPRSTDKVLMNGPDDPRVAAIKRSLRQCGQEQRKMIER